jgi:TRAP-type transport system small permease protein
MSTFPSVPSSHPPLAAFLRRIDGFLGVIAALALLALMGLTCIDVLGRYLFNRPLQGGFELTELGMGALIFTSLPLVTLRRQHVRVDLIDILPVRWRAFQHAFLDLIAAGCMGVIGWRLWLKAVDMAQAGETTATLQIPVYPLVYYMALMAFVTTALIVLFAWEDAFGTGPAPEVVS